LIQFRYIGYSKKMGPPSMISIFSIRDMRNPGILVYQYLLIIPVTNRLLIFIDIY